MSKIIFNKQLSKDFFLMKTEHKNDARAGQFYMLRAWESFPVLSRPISVFDADEDSVTFLYKSVGQGTEIFAGLKSGDDITLQGAYGNGFPVDSGKGRIALVGGGVGIAPLYFTAKSLKALDCVGGVDIYLGFSDEALLQEEFKQTADDVIIDVGGYITDKIKPVDYDMIFSCGPEIMMRKLYEKCLSQNTAQSLYVSMENRMACGIGACLVCSCKTMGGNKKICKDGPVFKAEEVFSNELA